MRTIDKRVRRLEDLELCGREQNTPTETGEAKRLYLERLKVIGERLQGAKDRGEWVAPKITVEQAREMIRARLEAIQVEQEENERRIAERRMAEGTPDFRWPSARYAAAFRRQRRR